jgi:hypothetical protein
VGTEGVEAMLLALRPSLIGDLEVQKNETEPRDREGDANVTMKESVLQFFFKFFGTFRTGVHESNWHWLSLDSFQPDHAFHAFDAAGSGGTVATDHESAAIG